MDKYTATEQAYKNGYEKGYAKAKAEFEQKKAHLINNYKWFECDNCHSVFKRKVSYCSSCGRKIIENEVEG